MVESAELAVSFLEGMGKEDFLDDIRTQQAIILNFLVIGEMAERLAREHPDFWKRHPKAPWQKMTAKRDRIAHRYFELNSDRLGDGANRAARIDPRIKTAPRRTRRASGRAPPADERQELNRDYCSRTNARLSSSHAHDLHSRRERAPRRTGALRRLRSAERALRFLSFGKRRDDGNFRNRRV